MQLKQKLQIQQRVLQNGVPLPLEKFKWDEEARVFSTKESNLVLDFFGESGWTFKTGDNCHFTTWGDCTFLTGKGCTFKTGDNCTFKTKSLVKEFVTRDNRLN